MKKLIPPRKEIETIKTRKEKKERGKEKEELDIKRLFNENRRLIAGGIVSVLFLANLIHYFVLIICFLILALYKKSEKTDTGTKKKIGVTGTITAYIKNQYETNPKWIFWLTAFVIVFVIVPLVLVFLLVVISLMLH